MRASGAAYKAGGTPDARRLGMRTPHLALYAALALGIVAAIALSIANGFWLDLNIPLGQKGILAFLGATLVIFLFTEAIAGFLGDQVDHWRVSRRRVS